MDVIRLQNISLSFNGGKDCTPWLDLVLVIYLTFMSYRHCSPTSVCSCSWKKARSIRRYGTNPRHLHTRALAISCSRDIYWTSRKGLPPCSTLLPSRRQGWFYDCAGHQYWSSIRPICNRWESQAWWWHEEGAGNLQIPISSHRSHFDRYSTFWSTRRWRGCII